MNVVETLDTQITIYGDMIITREALIDGRYVVAAEDYSVAISPEISIKEEY